MMYEIKHSLEYNYQDAVRFEPYSIRLKPRHDCTQHLLSFKYSIDPLPISTYENLDHDGNVVVIALFKGYHHQLRVNFESIVETQRKNPFDYLLDHTATTLYNPYSKPMKTTLAHYLFRRHPDPAIDSITQNLLKQTDFQTTPFLIAASNYIYQNFRAVLRDVGMPLHPTEVIANQAGTCRDFAVFFMEICRTAGLAARFISGYSEDNPDLAIEKQEMHSWVEVYLPGGGWRGFDPSLGMATADWHIALAAGADPHEASSTSGTFFGVSGFHDFNYYINLKNLGSSAFARPTHKSQQQESIINQY